LVNAFFFFFIRVLGYYLISIISKKSQPQRKKRKRERERGDGDEDDELRFVFEFNPKSCNWVGFFFIFVFGKPQVVEFRRWKGKGSER